MPIRELEIIATTIDHKKVIVSLDIYRKPDIVESLGSVENPLIASKLVEHIVPLKEDIDQAERRSDN